MPYPILSLPYPFLKRLPQLLNPEELRNVQRVTRKHPSRKLFGPKVNYYDIHETRFDGDTSTVITFKPTLIHGTDNSEEMSIDNKKAYFDTQYSWFCSLTEAVFDNPHFANIYIRCTIAVFENCQITPKFMEKFAKRVKHRTLPVIDISQPNIIDSDVTFLTFFDLFPQLRNVFSKYCYDGWLKDLLKVENTGINGAGITLIGIVYEDWDVLMGFSADEFERFFEKNDNPSFDLIYKTSLELLKSKNWYKKRIDEAFGPRFKTLGGFNSNIKVTVEWMEGDSRKTYKWRNNRK